MKSTIILYHANCPDGFSAAWAAWKKLKNKADYLPVEHQTPPPQGLEGKMIYMLDFAYPPNIIQDLAEKNEKIVVIDHHTSAYASIISLIRANKGYKNIEAIEESKSSGAVLAWQYFHSKKPLPQIIKYVEDGDLWKFNLPHAKEILAVIDDENHNFASWDKLAKKLENTKTRKEIIKKGSIIVKHKKRTIGRLVSKAKDVKLAGYKAKVVNSPIFPSEIGNELISHGADVGIIWYDDNKKIKVSLRSKSSGKVNVAKIAEKFGGGGHKAAASFRIPKDTKLPWEK
ncbi:MAG: DHHA1 domain-containing protein [Nanoarchaeota archaeon]|nr:DHHA1 domain-containing protein [Nanoarchaeota archaeon]